MKKKRFFTIALLAALILPGAKVWADDTSDPVQDVNAAIGSIEKQLSDVRQSVDNIGLYGDVRVRYSWKSQSSSASGDVISDQDNEQVRARIGIRKTFGDVVADVRLATLGGANYPNSQTPSLGSGLAGLPVYFDRVSINWTPSLLGKEFTVGGGRFANPLDSTPITWDDSLSLDGAWAQWSLPDTGTKLRTVYVDYDNPQAATSAPAANPVTVNGQQVDSYIWTTQLSQSLKLDKNVQLDLTLGFEYIPYVTQLAGIVSVNGKTLLTDGMIYNYGSTIPNIEMGEFLASFKDKLFADLPMKWTLHMIDNFNSFNVPNYYAQTEGSLTSSQDGYSNQSNNWGGWLSVDFGSPDTPAKDAFGLRLAYAYLEPNAQLSVLTNHFSNFTNSKYAYWEIGFGLEKNVSIQWKSWLDSHVYDETNMASVGTSYTKIFGASSDPEWINFFEANVSF